MTSEVTRKKLRLVKVRTQAVFVLDDGDTLTEIEAQVVEVPAVEWPSYAEGSFKQALNDLENGLNNSEVQSTTSS